jgi:SAM-dependent methyltransferase
MDELEVDRDALRASFGDTAGSYQAARPEWPAFTARWLTGTDDGGPLAGRGSLRVLDLGAGTGKLTATLVAEGHDVVAVDSSSGMLDELRAARPHVEVHLAPAERLPLVDASVDAVTVAQAWHWFDAAAAAGQCARVLRPGGVLGIAWHVRDGAEEWIRELDALVGRQAEATASRWDVHMDLPEPFGPVQRALFAYRQRLAVDDVVALASSWSYVAVRPDREEVLARVAALARGAAGDDGFVVMPYRTRCYRSVRG